MKNKTCTVLFLVTGLILLAGTLAPLVVAREGIWGTDWLNPSFIYRLGPEVQLSPSPQCDTSDEHTPAVAYNYVHKEYLVVWDNEWPGGSRDIYARRVSEGGQILSWFAITTGANNRLRPAVAYNAANNEYLVVWMYEVSSNVYEIWGRIIPWNGPGTNAEFRALLDHPVHPRRRLHPRKPEQNLHRVFDRQHPRSLDPCAEPSARGSHDTSGRAGPIPVNEPQRVALAQPKHLQRVPALILGK